MPQTIRIFVSSPGDVAEERGLAQQVLERLQAEFGDDVRLEPFFWEHEPLTLGAGFQDQIRLPSEHDLVIIILWSRIGTRLHPRYAPEPGKEPPTGTEFEVEDALRSWRQHQRPDVLLFVGTAPVIGDLAAPDTKARIAQQEQVKAFIHRVVSENPDIGLAAHHPYLAPWDFASQLETKVRKWLDRRLGESLTRGAAWRGSPYRGLHVFEAEHQLIFRGRRQAVSEVIGRLKTLSEAMDTSPAEATSRPRMFLLIQGMSGNGKSSLVRAGILPLVQVGAVAGVGAWRRAIVKPSDASGNVFLSLARALTHDATDPRDRALPELLKAGQSMEDLAADLERQPGAALGRIKGALADIAEKAGLQASQVRLVVFVDQLEELFDPRIDKDLRRNLIASLDSLASGPQVWVLATLRSDFVHRCEEISTLADLRRGRVYELDKPDTASLIEMIEEPARLAGLRFEERGGQKLSQLILKDTAGNSEALPLVEFVLARLYQRSKDGLLTYKAYKSLGRLQGALTRAAETAVTQALTGAASGESAFVRVMRELVGIDEGGSRTRRRVPQKVFEAGSAERKLVDALVRKRLLTADHDESDQPVVSVAHETLLQTKWPRLQEWLDRESQLLVLRRNLEQRYREWQASNESPDLLLSAGLPLDQAEDLVKRQFPLETTVRRFVDASRAAENRRLKRRHRARHLLASGLLFVVLVFAGFTVSAVRQARAASRQVSLVLSEDARRAIENGEYERAARLGALAAREGLLDVADPAAGPILAAAAQRSSLILEIRGHRGPVNGFAESPDGMQLLTWSKDRTARVWDAETGAEIAHSRHRGWVLGATFDAMGKRVLSWDTDGIARVWNAATGDEIAHSKHERAILRAIFDATGKRVLSWDEAILGGSGIARVWSAETGDEIAHSRHDGGILGATFDVTGKRVLSWGTGIAKVWNAATGDEIAHSKHRGWVLGAIFDTTGKRERVLSWGTDGIARVWDAATGNEIAHLKHRGWVLGAIFDTTGKRVLSWGHPVPFWGTDGIARVWNAATGNEIAASMHEGEVFGAIFDTTGERVLSWGKRGAFGEEGGIARVWNAATGNEIAASKHEGEVNGAIFDATGECVLSWDKDGVARVWSAATGNEIAASMHEGEVKGALFDATDERVLSWGNNGVARVWDAATGSEIATLKHEGDVVGAVFDATGKRVLSWGGDGVARVWNAATGNEIAALELEGDIVGSIFDATGKHVLSWGYGFARVWNAATGDEIVAAKHEEGVYGAIFNATAKRMLSWDSAGILRVWNAATGDEIAATKHEGRVYGAIFDATGKRVLSSGEDGIARVWNAATGDEIAATKHEGKVYGAIFDATGKRVLSWGDDGIARVWNATTGDEIAATKHEGEVNGAIFDVTGKRVLSRSNDGFARVWNAATGDEIATAKHEGGVFGAIFDVTGKRVLSWDNDGIARVWNATTGDEITTAKHEGGVNDAIFDATGKRVLSWDNDRIARVWDAATGDEIATAKHEGWVNGAIFNTTGERVLSWDDDGIARVWDTARSIEIATLRHESEIVDAMFDAAGKRVITTAADAMIRVWDVIWSVPRPSNRALIDEVCKEKLRGAEISLNIDGKLIPASVRRISKADADFAPILRDRIGEDVCASSSWWQAARDKLVRLFPESSNIDAASAKP